MTILDHTPHHKTAHRLAKYPALAGTSHKLMNQIATWADEITIQPGDTIAGLGPIDRWSYLVADPTATVIEGGQPRAAGQAIGLVRALRTRPAAHTVPLVACERLDLLAIPPTRLTGLLEQVPGLIRVAFDQTAPTSSPEPRPTDSTKPVVATSKASCPA